VELPDDAELIGRAEGYVWVIASCDGHPVALCDHRVLVYESEQPDCLAENVTGMVALPDGRLAVGYERGRLEFLDVSSGHEEPAEHVWGGIRDLAVDSTGQFIAASVDSGDLTVWRDGRRLWVAEGPTHMGIYSIAIGTDGRVYTGGGRDRSIAVWDLLTGEHIGRVDTPGRDIYPLIVSRDAHHWLSWNDLVGWVLWHSGVPTWLDRGVGTALETLDGKSVLVANDRYLIRYDWSGEHLGQTPLARHCPAMAWAPGGELWLAASALEPTRSYDIWRVDWDRLPDRV